MLVESKDASVKKDILKAAHILFQKYGLKKTSMEDIAEQAGKGKSTLYHYYKNKNEIFYHVLKTECGMMKEAAREAVNSAQDECIEDRLALLTASKIRSIEEFHVFGDYAKEYFVTNMERFAEAILDYNQFEHAAIKDILHGEFEKGKLVCETEECFEQTVTLIANLLRGLYMSAMLEENYEETINNLPNLIQLILRGIYSC
ncbi:MAG: TetR/AcrR family transcriptional regulator [Bacteroidota bacterium]